MRMRPDTISVERNGCRGRGNVVGPIGRVASAAGVRRCGGSGCGRFCCYGRVWEAKLIAGQADEVAELKSRRSAAMFPGDAEFDDPLIDSEARGCRLELAGEGIVDDRKVARLLVTRNGGVPFVHLLNRETFFTGQRIDPRRGASDGTRRWWCVTIVFGRSMACCCRTRSKSRSTDGWCSRL